ncbi:hypothetical protein MVEN_01323200 [Mycena venus]|uniref:Uncharacterized protein n=1 Tax=Mycena venus TaxID=2733690 RepID=A0A8H7CVZ2_9AGAR|nr:hypothetical protein MVEN_01323200 [Mycena venus]
MSLAPLVYVLLAFFWTEIHAALVIRTVEDFSPVVQYNCSIQRCDADMENPNPCPGADGSFNRTFMIMLPTCQIRIPFTGTAVYAFLGGFIENCTFDIDNTGSHPSSLQSDGLFTETGLTYFNTSLPNGTHTLVISGSDFAFDSVIYTFDDVPTGLPVPIQSSSSPTTLTSPPVIASSPKNSGDIRDSRVFLGDMGELDLRPDLQSSSPRSPDNTALEEQVRMLRAQTAKLQLALRAQQAPSADTRLSSMKQEQTRAVRKGAPRGPAADSVLHTDSGIRFTPARQAKEIPPDYTLE